MDSQFVSWTVTAILGAALSLLGWYFKRDQDTTKARLNRHSERLDQCVTESEFSSFKTLIGTDLKHIEKNQVDMSEKFAKALQAGLEQMRRDNQQMLNEMHRRIDDHSKKHDERLDRIIMLITQSNNRPN